MVERFIQAIIITVSLQLAIVAQGTDQTATSQSSQTEGTTADVVAMIEKIEQAFLKR
ncbi:MAG: hypothetical protein AAFY78_16095 [Cyanobacteria bacterium J06648_16]